MTCMHAWERWDNFVYIKLSVQRIFIDIETDVDIICPLGLLYIKGHA